LEIHCHGGAAAAERILRDLAGAGCRITDWHDALRHDQSLLRAEILDSLCRATTLRTAAMLWEQANGVFETAIRHLVSSAEGDLPAAAAQLREWLAWSDFGLHLTRPWRVVLVGRPNVGKSSLINAILGYARALVFDQPGTTRDVVSASTAIDGWPIELSDTAGLRESVDPLESAGIERARAALESTDLAVVLIDTSQPASQHDRTLIASRPRALVVAHKCDLAPYEGPDRWHPSEREAWYRVSSRTGEGVEALIAAIASTLVPCVPPPEALIPTTERQVTILTRALKAADRSDLAGFLLTLRELGTEPTCSAGDPAHAASRKGSPATS
jgi:tRNA modification GTPase